MALQEPRIERTTAGALYEATIPEAGQPQLWRTLPQSLPDAGIRLLIGSCFWINDARDGFYSAAVKELVQRERPVFKVLIGDQLYADMWAPLPHTLPQGLAQKYERYWGASASRDALAACPTLVSCDDHEFCNDFPRPQTQVKVSWDRYQPAAGAALFDAYQSSLNPDGNRWTTASIPPVSFFVADTRSHRTRDDDPHARLVLLPPAFRSGCERTSTPGDRTLLDFEESDRFGAIFECALSSHDILILTGDIHTGRLSGAAIVRLGGQVHELVASPASLVTPDLPPLGHKPAEPPDKLTINRRTWQMKSTQRLTATVDDNAGLIRIAPGRNGRYRSRCSPGGCARWWASPAGSSSPSSPRARSRSTTRSKSSSAEEENVLRHSQSDIQNPNVVDWTDSHAGGDNATSFTDAIAELSEHDGLGLIAPVGSCDLPGVAPRRARSIPRWDRRPSLRSHAFLPVGGGELREVALHSGAGHFPEPAANAITPARLDHYGNATLDPNLALLSVRLDAEEAERVTARATESPKLERLPYDLFETLGVWQAYPWTRGTPNGLEQGVSTHSSAMVEYCFEESQQRWK